MLKQLEAQHKLYGSLEEMLAPEMLSELLSKSVSSVEIRLMTNHRGLLGSKLYSVDTNAGRFVLKQMSMAHDYGMYATNDQHCRSVRLWQYGLLDELRPDLEHKIIACAQDGDGWGILMHDLSDGLFGRNGEAMTPKLAWIFLDHLANLHAQFWNDPRLKDPHIGLANVSKLLNVSSLKMAQKHTGDQRGQVPSWAREGWKILETILEPDLFRHLSRLYEQPQPLLEAMERYPYTLVHNDYRQDNLAYLDPDQVVVFDWQSATHGLMTADLTRFTRDHNSIRNSIGEEKAVGYYRDRLETYLGTGFDDDTWQTMLDLGYLLNAFLICFFAYFSERADEPEWKAYWDMRIEENKQSIREGLRWL